MQVTCLCVHSACTVTLDKSPAREQQFALVEAGKAVRYYGALRRLLKVNFCPLFLEGRLFFSFLSSRKEERIQTDNARNEGKIEE